MGRGLDHLQDVVRIQIIYLKKTFLKNSKFRSTAAQTDYLFELFLRPENYFGSEKDSSNESRK